MRNVMQQWKAPAEPIQLSQQARNFVDEINRKHTAGETTGQLALEAELRFLNTTRECGVLLEDAKATLSPTQWKLAQTQFKFNEQQVQGLLDFARKFPEPIKDAREAIKSLPDAQMALGLAEFPQGHGQQTLRDYNFAIEFTKGCTVFLAQIKKGLTRTPIEDMTPGYAAQLVAQSASLVAQINEIFAKAKVKAGEN